MQQTCSRGEGDCFFPVNKDKEEKEDKEEEEEEEEENITTTMQSSAEFYLWLRQIFLSFQ